MLYNWIANPTRAVLQQSDVTEYGVVEPKVVEQHRI